MIINQERAITGNVATLKFYISLDKNNKYLEEKEPRLYYMALENQEKLRFEVEDHIKGILGSQFDIVRFEIKEGSVEILVIIGTTYVLISRYKNFLESLKILKGQLENIFRRFFRKNLNNNVNYDIKIESGLTLGAGITNSKAVIELNVFNYTVFYLMLTNLILIGALIYLVLK